MKKIKTQALLLFLFFSLSLAAQQQVPCSCCTEDHKSFDFWVGDWIVYDTLGKQVGENLIIELEDHCILSENWIGSSGSTGKSYNYFDRADSTWNQLWIDNSGNNLKLKGNLEGQGMVLRSDLLTSEKGVKYYNQIRWTPNLDGSVTQLWEIYSEDRKLLSEAFQGIYRRRVKK